MFNQVGKQSVTLSLFGGLVTEAPSASLAEGSSPLCWDVDFLVGSVFTRPGLSSVYGAGVNAQNFIWIKTFALPTGQVYTLALAANGTLWREDVTNAPGTLTQIEAVMPSSAAHGVTAFSREYIAINGDIPRQYDGTNFDRVSQEGPAAPLLVNTTSTANLNQANITAYAVTSNVVTFTAVNTFAVGEFVQISCASPAGINGLVLGVQSASGTQFTVDFSTANASTTSVTGTAVPQNNFPIATITQPAAQSINEQVLWSSAADAEGTGTIGTIYYSQVTQDSTLTSLFNSGIPVYVYINFGTLSTIYPNGTYKVTALGRSRWSSNNAFYFTIVFPSMQYHKSGPPLTGLTYQITAATVAMTSPAPGTVAGNSVTIGGVTTPTQWNGQWTILQATQSGVFQVTQTQVDVSGNATYTYTIQAGVAPVVGDLVTVTNTTGYNGQLNVTNAAVSAVGTNTFTVVLSNNNGAGGPYAETGQAEVSGKQFLIDPGPLYVSISNATSPIFGNATTGSVVVLGQTLNIAAGTRQAVCMFLTRNGFLTKPSPPVTFTVPANASSIQVSNIPVGPPNVTARWLAFTEAGANGVPGAYFYVIPVPVQTIVNGQPYTYAPTTVNDNVTTSATFSFVDAVLLSAMEIDITGGNQFNQVELGSSQWCINYANRMFFGLEQNKVTNFVNMSFNGGSPSAVLLSPLGWTPSDSYGSLVTSPSFGWSYQITNTSGSTQASLGAIVQPAFQDAYKVPIIQPNIAYGFRVAASLPVAGTGDIVVDLVTFDQQLGFGAVIGSYTIPFTSLTSTLQVFTSGTIISNTALKTVPQTLVLRVRATNITNGAAVLIDHLEVFPTTQPVLNTSLRASYVNNPEAFDSVSGNLYVQGTNTQSLNGAFVMYDQLFLLKASSMFSTQDTPGSEPSGWQVSEVSNEVGACGPEAYDVGEEWAVTACRKGIYVFYGRQPIKINQEIFQVWEAVNWPAASSIWVRNDLINRRILVGVPMATPNAWLPNAPVNANPTTPNVILMLNYQGLGDVMSLGDGKQMHTTMFGTLMSVDMRRKWSLWQIASPSANFVERQDGISRPLFLGNGAANGKIYQLLNTQRSDDGAAINSTYTTYGFVDAAKAQQSPLLGFHRKLWSYLQMLVKGAGALTIKMLPNNLIPATPFSAVTLPAITLSLTPGDDLERPLNVAGNRMFVQFSTDAVNAWFELERLILVGSQAPLALRGSAAQ